MLLSISVSRQTTDSVPEPVARVADLMSTFGPMWCLCGGWAVDAWLGRQTRDHHDVDIAVFEDDLGAVFDHFAGHQLIAHDSVAPDSTELWDGRRLYPPVHIHARLEDGSNLDLYPNERAGLNWVLSDEPRIAMELRRCTEDSAWGLPTLSPDVILFYKATETRPQDETDFRALLPHLAEEQLSWLRESIALLHPDHPWLAQLRP